MMEVLHMDKTADVIIVGGGIVGCAAAYYLAKRGISRVTVLEAAKSIGNGGSSRNGGGVRQSGRDIRELRRAGRGCGLRTERKPAPGQDARAS